MSNRLKPLPVIAPRYVTRFSCIGQKCEDSCCSGWKVFVDKDSAAYYAGVDNVVLSPIFQKALQRSDKTLDAEWASIELKPNSHDCSFLENKSCLIQSELGEDALCDVCFTYPRRTHSIAGTHVQTLTLSCPEAARQALLAPDAFELVNVTRQVRPKMPMLVDGASAEEMMLFCAELVREPALALWQRLAVLGLFCQEISEVDANIKSALQKFRALAPKEIATALASLAPNYQLQTMIFLQLLQTGLARAGSEHQNRVYHTVVAGLGATDDGHISLEGIQASYERGLARLPEAMKDVPWLLEHYLQNEILGGVFPSKMATPYAAYLQLACRFGVLRLMLAARCTGKTLPTPEELVATTQVFCHRFHHDPSFAKTVSETLDRFGLSRLDKLYAFLRA